VHDVRLSLLPPLPSPGSKFNPGLIIDNSDRRVAGLTSGQAQALLRNHHGQVVIMLVPLSSSNVI